MGFLHGLGEFVLRHVLVVAFEVDILDTDLVALLHVEVHPDGAADHGILLHLGVHLAQEVALFLVVTLDDVLGGALHVVGEFAAGTEVQAFLQVLPFTGLDAGIGPAGDTGTFLDDNLEPRGILRHVQRVHDHGHVLEETLRDQALDDTRHLLARNGEFHAGAEAGQLQDLVLRPSSRRQAILRIIIVSLIILQR